MTPSTQPTHHGYAVNVKDHAMYDHLDRDLSDGEVEAIYNAHGEAFWEDAQDIAQRHGFNGVYSDGNMGGWAQPYPQPYDALDDDELAAWVKDKFRPFEADILACLDDRREAFIEDVNEANVRAVAEPAEAAYWAARDVVTVDA